MFSATQISPGQPLANALVTFDDGARQQFVITATAQVTAAYFGVPLSWSGHQTATSIEFAPSYADVVLRGMTSIDATDKSFLPQPVRAEHDMRLIHSGDVKIYQNLRPAPRALLRTTAGVSNSSAMSIPVAITLDQPEALELAAQVPSAGAWSLVLRDTCYPGWVARIDGVVAPIRCSDILFREIDVPAGAHQISFRYEPASVRYGWLLSGAGGAAWLLLAALALRNRPRVRAMTAT